MNIITIKQPRWHDKVVLIAQKKVRAQNYIVFSEAKSLPYRYPITGSEIQKYPLGSNGVIPCYEVPLKILEDNLEIKESVNYLFGD